MGWFKTKFRQIKKFPRWIYWLPARTLQLFAHTLFKIRYEDPDNLRSSLGGYIGYTWHNRLLYFPSIMPRAARYRTAAVVSASRDGQYIADLISIYGVRSLRGSSSRGGAHALLDSVRALKEENLNVIFTPDGPRGPRYRMKPGPVMLASLTGAPLCPLSINVTKCWSAKSWDGFQIPKPGATITLVIGKPMMIPPGLDDAGIEEWRLKAEEALNAITVDPPEEKEKKKEK
ncbi:MAG: lysophospholipid acyltransferase family protein [Lentisphaeria bacterium]|nr:lysophospholipid acyltransferase family protein [Lentisphaeria bacterium]